MEWVIVNGSKTTQDSIALEKLVIDPTFTKNLPFPIVYIPYEEGRKLGGHRNAGNDVAKGDIIICVDDDDYYQPVYIEHAVATLTKSKKLLAGCGPIYIYDLYWRTVFQLDLITPFSSVNNCFCYKREYLKNHRYLGHKESGEEVDFTNNFKEPLEQLDPKKCIIQIAHTFNTVFKQKLLLSAFFGMHIGYNIRNIPITDLIRNKEAMDAYHNILGPRQSSLYDIVYYAGTMSIVWDPTSTALGGSEQAVVQLAKAWAVAGKKVAVYGDLDLPNAPPRNTTHVLLGERISTCYESPEGVHYYHFSQFHPWQTFNTLIIWRLYGTAPIMNLAPGIVKAKHVLIDIHDNVQQHYEIIQSNLDKMAKQSNTVIMFKSVHHAKVYQQITNTQPLAQKHYAMIPNGIQIPVFLTPQAPVPKRDPFRFCYASAYNRGIIPILYNIWPIIQKLEPKSELHIYYGIDKSNPGTKQLQEEFNKALAQSTNVCDHGRQTLEVVAREKHYATFQLYLCDSHEEIDCISVRESLVAGCIPILLNHGVFQERDGFKVQGNMYDAISCMNIAMQIYQFMSNGERVSQLREKLKSSPTILDWKAVAHQWLEIMR